MIVGSSAENVYLSYEDLKEVMDLKSENVWRLIIDTRKRGAVTTMTLFAETLDDLQKLAQDKFRDVRNIGREEPRFSGQPCLKEHLQVIISSYTGHVPESEAPHLKRAPLSLQSSSFLVSACDPQIIWNVLLGE